MTTESDCDSFFPYFVLVKEGRAIGIGWQIIGKSEKFGRHWFEHPPSRAVEVSILKLISIISKSNTNKIKYIFSLLDDNTNSTSLSRRLG